MRAEFPARRKIKVSMFATWDDVNGYLLARLRPRILKRVEVVSVIRVAVRQCEMVVL